MAQYPLGMGLKQSQGKNSNAIVPLQVGKDGKVKYDVLVRQGHHKDRVRQYIISPQQTIILVRNYAHFTH